MWLIEALLKKIAGGMILILCAAFALGFPGGFVFAFLHNFLHGQFVTSLIIALSGGVSLAFWAGVRTTKVGYAVTEKLLALGLNLIGTEEHM
jgi:hypothetical protein